MNHLFQANIKSLFAFVLVPVHMAAVCIAPHRPVLIGVPVLPGVDGCVVPCDGWLPLP